MRRFNKIAGSNFEHQRHLLMARRVEGRKPGVTLPVIHDELSIGFNFEIVFTV